MHTITVNDDIYIYRVNEGGDQVVVTYKPGQWARKSYPYCERLSLTQAREHYKSILACKALS